MYMSLRLFLTLGVLLKAIVHVFYIFSESLLVLSQSDSFFISMFKSFSIFSKSFPWINMLVSSAYIMGKVI